MRDNAGASGASYAYFYPERGPRGRTVEGALTTLGPTALNNVERPLASQLAAWVSHLSFTDLPDDVVATTKLRVLDVIGLALAGSETAFGRSTRDAAVALSPPGRARIFGTGEHVAVPTAAFANAAFAQALEFDDTHNESIVHMSSPAVAAALAMSQNRRATGRDVIVAIALANEISSRVGSVAPGQFHRRGFHPTGLFAPFGITYLAGRLLGSDAETMARAAGICGSVAAGLLECWVDGTQSKFLHSGFAAQSGIVAATLAHAGVTGPPTVLEGRFGLFASHLQDPQSTKDLDRVTRGLGTTWESRNASFKPYPAAHVLHPYVDAVLRAKATHRITAADVSQIDCPVAEFNVSIVCEPMAEKLAPASDSHARISLQYTIAEALHEGRLGKTAYSPENLRNPAILGLARRVRYAVDPDFPPPGRFKGAVRITLHDGRVIDETQEHNLGSPENPMTASQLRAKFDENAGGVLSAAERGRLADDIDRLEQLDDAGAIVERTIPHV
jgi:2-methylcitrate dehydratase PrpD